MHLFLVKSDDARAFAHLHPIATDSSAVPPFSSKLPPLPAGTYRVYGDVVHETGFERTLVGSVSLQAQRTLAPTARAAARGKAPAVTLSDPDDAWFIGEATRERIARLADGSIMELTILPARVITAGREETLRIIVSDRRGEPARLEPYLGMAAHAAVIRLDGSVYVHLHPMGTITTAAQAAFLARDRGDTTANGALTLVEVDGQGHDYMSMPAEAQGAATIEFPYAFPRPGGYRLFIQVKRGGRVLTGAFAVTVVDSAAAR
jgi:hypothetical protein